MRAAKKRPIQIYLDPEQDRALRAISKKRGISKAEIVRLSLSHFIRSLPVEDDPALEIIALGKSGKTDLSERHDDYLSKHSAKKKESVN